MELHERPFSKVLNRFLGRGICLGIRVSLYQDSWLDVGLDQQHQMNRSTDQQHLAITRQGISQRSLGAPLAPCLQPLPELPPLRLLLWHELFPGLLWL